MWAALQRRFNDQNRPGCARELLARGLKVLPIDGQTSSVTWSLGFKETGSCSRTASLSRDFQSLASMVEAEQACYLLAFVGDLHGGSLGTVATSNSDPAKWILISFVPESCTASLAKRMADNRTGLKVRRIRHLAPASVPSAAVDQRAHTRCCAGERTLTLTRPGWVPSTFAATCGAAAGTRSRSRTTSRPSKWRPTWTPPSARRSSRRPTVASSLAGTRCLGLGLGLGVGLGVGRHTHRTASPHRAAARIASLSRYRARCNAPRNAEALRANPNPNPSSCRVAGALPSSRIAARSRPWRSSAGSGASPTPTCR
jgi:hypothetical protein